MSEPRPFKIRDATWSMFPNGATMVSYDAPQERPDLAYGMAVNDLVHAHAKALETIEAAESWIATLESRLERIKAIAKECT